MRMATWTRTAYHAALPYTSLPAYAAFPLFPLLFYSRLWTVAIAFVCVFSLWYMDKKGYNASWIINRLKGKLNGNRVSARPTWFLRRRSYMEDVIE